jgi:hypothetical protein
MMMMMTMSAAPSATLHRQTVQFLVWLRPTDTQLCVIRHLRFNTTTRRDYTHIEITLLNLSNSSHHRQNLASTTPT